MTVSTTTNKIIYAANGVTTAWTFPFPGVAASDILVYVTTSSGAITQLATNLYSVTLNAAVAPNPTGIGGQVNYPLVGSPLAAGNTLTILRSLPLTQPTSMTPQQTLYQPVIEGALDDIVLQLQQLNELLSRQITVAVSDPTPTALPPVAQRANLIFGFDGAGNPSAVALPSGSVAISAPMIPVVGAASLAAARTALGLGSIATLGVGSGLVSDGTNVNIAALTQTISINHTIDVTENNHHHYATGQLTVIIPKASTCFNGWATYLTALDSTVTISIDAADSFYGMSAGQSLSIPAGATVMLNTDGTTTWFATLQRVPSVGDVDNLQISASVAANALTIAVKDVNGNDPSVTSPVLIPFRSPTATNGGPVIRAITLPLAITVPAGASLGTTSGGGCRVWVTCFDNAGTLVLGVYVSANYTTLSIKSWEEAIATNGTAISAGSTAAQTHYTASGVTGKCFKVLGYIDITEATAGQWSSAPTRVELFSPGCRKPGDLIQVQSGTSAGSNSSVGATPTATPLTVSIIPTYTSSLMKISANGGSITNPGSGSALAQLYRDAAATLFGPAQTNTGTNIIHSPVSLSTYHYPSSAVTVVYGVATFGVSGNATWNALTQATDIIAEEIFV